MLNEGGTTDQAQGAVHTTCMSQGRLHFFYLIILEHKRHPGQLSVEVGGLVSELDIAGVSHEKYQENRFHTFTFALKVPSYTNFT